MKLFNPLATAIALVAAVSAQSTAGLKSLLERRMPNHVKDFDFKLVSATMLGVKNTTAVYDSYSVTSKKDGSIEIHGTTVSALSLGLHRYATDVLHLDIYWFVGSRLYLAPTPLPPVNGTLTGSSVVPWRYHFNTVTFDYTSAYWSWEDWELELDWLALRGVNLPLAWVGYEYFLIQAFQEIGFTDDEIASFLSSPPTQAWNRFGNLAGSWGGELPFSWVNQQYALQKKIIARMSELGMTPVLPGFAGFVPRAIKRVAPNASVVNGSNWEAFPTALTNTTFLNPADPLFYTLQKKLVQKQQVAYGNVSHIYTIDSYNENTPPSSNASYLASVSANTVASLKAADPDAVWMLQGWLFSSLATFWTNDAVKAFIGNVSNSDIIILDLFSESQPQWQRTSSYYGKPFIWCQLHDYGANQGLYGQIQNITTSAINALRNASNLIGFGNSMEGQEGNEIMYDLMLDQAWSSTPINTQSYFRSWVTSRYSSGPSSSIPAGLYSAWEALRTTVYNNTNLTANAVPKAIYELSPNISGLTNRTGHHPTTLNYNPAVVTQAWSLFYNASLSNPSLYDSPTFQYDFVDITRQLIANAFIPLYQSFVTTYSATGNSTTMPKATTTALLRAGQPLLDLLTSLDEILATNPNFLLSKWLDDAVSWTNSTDLFHFPTASISEAMSANATMPIPNYTTENSTGLPVAAYYEYAARNQITLWGPNGNINDYASKSWAGLVSSYYLPRWTMFVRYCAETPYHQYNVTMLNKQLLAFEQGWQTQSWGSTTGQTSGTKGVLAEVLGGVVRSYTQAGSGIFGA